MNTKQMIEVMQASVDGKVIQCRQWGQDKWNDVIGFPDAWNWIGFEYRIKPDKIAGYVIVGPHGKVHGGMMTEEKALRIGRQDFGPLPDWSVIPVVQP